MHASIHLWYTGTLSSFHQRLFWGIFLSSFLDVNSDRAEHVDRSEAARQVRFERKEERVNLTVWVGDARYGQPSWNTVDREVDERSICVQLVSAHYKQITAQRKLSRRHPTRTEGESTC
jgi:hypothetical protein